MSMRENKELVRQLFKEWNALNGDVAQLHSLYKKYYTPDFIHHDPSGAEMKGEQRIQYAAMVLTAFPDMKWSIDEMMSEGDTVVCRYTMRFSHTGEFMGIAPTGRQIVAKGADIRKIYGGKVVDSWDFPDTMGIMLQVGAVPNRPAQE